MKSFLALLFSSLLLVSTAQSLKTPFEKGDGNYTGTYAEVVGFYETLSEQSPYVTIKSMGPTDSGKPLHLVLVASQQPVDLSKQPSKTVVFINNGIHPGEPDGIEASMMIARDFANNTAFREKFDNLIIAMIPVYNVGGAINRNTNTRANQNGPVSHGFRGNARNFDLNRDFAKMDTKNAKSFQQIFQMLDPDLFIDTHVSNGADYQYVITHLATQHSKMGGALGAYIEETFTPALEVKMKAKDSEITPFVNVYNKTPDAEGFSQFLDNPRYSTGYAALFNTLGFMIETHMLKPFDQRVEASYDFLESILELAIEDGKKIRRLKQERINEISIGKSHPIAWLLDQEVSKPITFKGYEGEIETSQVTGLDRLKYDRNKPFTKTLPYFQTFKPSKEVIIPKAYIVPKAWHNIIDKLLASGCTATQLSKDSILQVESYRIASFETVSQPFEGHYLHYNTEATKTTRRTTLKEGDYIFPVDQKAGRFLIEVLEPEATDSYFNWNFFDTILQRKEGFSPYVFEEDAVKLLASSPELSAAFQQKKDSDPEFAKSTYLQLTYLFERSPMYESAHRNYPILRLVN